LQDVEALRKLSEGDPETYLSYWKQRQTTLSKTNPLYSQLSQYADRARSRIETVSRRTKALADYAKTNNHKAYLDFLIGELQNSTDPNEVAQLATQVNTLRGRVFSHSGGGNEVGGGVSKGDLAQAKVDYLTLRDAARATLSTGGTIGQNKPNAPVDLTRLDAAAKKYGDMLRAIVADTSLSNKVRSDAQDQLYAYGNEGSLEGTGPAYAVQRSKIFSDKNSIAQSGFDSAGTAAFNSEITAAAARGDTREVARLWAKRAADAEVTLQGLQPDGSTAKAFAQVYDQMETKAQQAAAVLLTKSKTIPEGARQRLDKLFGAYLAAGGTESQGTFNKKLAASPDAETFGKAVGLGPKARQQFAPVFNSAKEDVKSGAPATWNPLTHSWDGDPDRIADAKVATEVITDVLQLPGNKYAQQYPGLDVTKLSDGDKVDIALGQYAYAPPVPKDFHVAPVEGSPEATAHPDVAPVEQPVPASTTATSGRGPGMQAPLLTQDLGGPPPSPDSNQEFNSAADAADNFLTQFDVPALPEYSPPPTEQADLSEFFPFANAPQPRSMRAGVPY
jgi:hypothetical protein